METKKLEKIKIEKGRRIYFTYDGHSYLVNITNERRLRLSVCEGSLEIKPMADNCITFKEVD